MPIQPLARMKSVWIWILLLALPSAYAGPIREEAQVARKGNLVIVAIGINKYGDPKLRQMRYAAPDATKLCTSLQEHGRSSFKKVIVRCLIDELATLGRIRDTFESLIKTVRPDDTLVVFFGGYALMDATVEGGSQKEMLLLVHDTSFSDDGGQRQIRDGISLPLLGSWLSRAQARKQVVVLDACGKGAGIEALNAMTEQEVLLGKASARSRLVMGIDGFAIDSSRLKGGLLTTVLVRALAGAADVGPNPDGRITCYELEACLPRAFLETARSINFNGGRLRVRSIGEDFVVSEPGKSSKSDKSSKPPPSRGLVQEVPKDTPERAKVAPKRRNLGLLFATDEYDDPRWKRLSNPIHDARTLKEELESRYGFQVELDENPRLGDMMDRLDEYQLKMYGPDDQLLVFVAGHGSYNEILKQGYVIARNTESGPMPKSALPNSALRTAIEAIPCPHILVVLDTCFGGTFDEKIAQAGSRGSVYDEVDVETEVRRILDLKARLYLCSGGKEYVYDGEAGRHSPFAFKLLEGLRGRAGGNGFVTWTSLKEHVRPLKTQPRAGYFGSSDPGADFVFLVKK